MASEGHIVHRPVVQSYESVPRSESQGTREDEHRPTELSPRNDITFRGQLEVLENILVDVVSELKYHRQQLSIISAEKDTSGAVIQMGIAQAKNAVLSEELKTNQELKRAERA